MSDVCKTTYEEIKKDKKHRYVVFFIRDEKQIDVEVIGETTLYTWMTDTCMVVAVGDFFVVLLVRLPFWLSGLQPLSAVLKSTHFMNWVFQSCAVFCVQYHTVGKAQELVN